MLLDDDRCFEAGADESLGETLPGDPAVVLGAMDNSDLCRESSIVPDRLRLIQLSADEIGNLALVGCRCWSRWLPTGVFMSA